MVWTLEYDAFSSLYINQSALQSLGIDYLSYVGVGSLFASKV